MTDDDRKYFNAILVELKKKINEENSKVFINLYDDASGINRSMIPFFEAILKRIENLEILMFFSCMCDAGEQGVTPEQREVLKMMEWDKLLAEVLKGSSSTLGK